MDKIINSILSIRRSVWKTTTKQLIEKTLEGIKKNYKLDAHIQSFGATNKEAVNFCLNKIPSGIMPQTYKAIEPCTKEPGYIAFMQSPNGVVKIIVSLPYIENVTEKTSLQLLVKLEPNEITIDIINAYVGDFFDLLTIWENGIVQIPSWHEYAAQG
ncbi:MAG: hypothetical protein JWR54_2381 [Mucilaginibacter sp.]|nr:hypothetical protein [Mucilaginibacter sp.]